jgi:hypothetical protein
MPSSINYSSLGTANLLTKGAFGSRDSSSVLERLAISGNNTKYDSLDEMPQAEVTKLKEIKYAIATAARDSVNAEDLRDKTTIGLVGIQRLYDKLNAAGTSISTYSNGTTSIAQVKAMRLQLTDCLKSITDTLNSTYGSGSYVFGSGNDDTRPPVSDAAVTAQGNLAADGTASDSYVVVKSQAKDVTISKNLQIGTSINPSHDAFVSTIGGIWTALRAIDADPTRVPANLGGAGALFQKGMQSMSALTSDIKTKNDMAKTAIAENTKESDGAKQQLESFKVDDLTRIAEVKDMARLEEMKMALATSFLRDEQQIARMIYEAGRG